MKPNNMQRRVQGRLRALTREERYKRQARNERRDRKVYKKRIPGEAKS